ncbi:hypothetical protein CR513_36452, partial [Mucuna pruriens]
MEKPVGSLPTVSPPAFWAQPFNEEIDHTPIPQSFWELVMEPFDGTQDPYTHLQAFQTQMYISGGDDQLNCKLFPGTLWGVVMHWLATLPPRSIRTFSDLATFTTNKTKCLEVANLFTSSNAKAKPSKITWRALTTPRLGNSLALRKPLTMEEIRAWAEKHIEVEEDQGDRLEVEKQPRAGDTRPTQKGENRYPNKPKDYP